MKDPMLIRLAKRAEFPTVPQGWSAWQGVMLRRRIIEAILPGDRPYGMAKPAHARAMTSA